MNRQKDIFIIIIFSLIVFIGMAFLPRIPQYLSYHQFVDKRMFFGIPNFTDVISNLPFIIIGFIGSIYLVEKYNSCCNEEKLANLSYLIFFVSIFFTGFGSGYYHLNPNNTTMLWDRLPLAVSFMAMLSAIFYERFEIYPHTKPTNSGDVSDTNISKRILNSNNSTNSGFGMGVKGYILLLSLVSFGAFSIIYWHLTELQNRGDLRPYIIVQFYPMLLIPFLLWRFPSKFTRTKDMWIVMVFYAIAKIFELSDKLIWAMGNIISGHTVKHIFAGMTVYWILRMIEGREKVVYKNEGGLKC